MPQNPFYIEPASGLPGFQALQKGIGTRIEYEHKKTEEKKTLAKREEAARIIQGGDPDKITDFMIKNPDMSEELRKSMQHKDELTEQNYKESLERIIVGGELPSQVGVERSEFVDSRGGDATESMQFTTEAQEEGGNQEGARRKAELLYAMHFPKESKAYREAKGQEEAADLIGKIDPGEYTSESISKFQKSGDYSDLVFTDGKDKEYAPTELQKLINERQRYMNEGLTEDDPIIKAYDAKISGTDIDIEGMTPDEIDTWGQYVNLTGKMPSLGRGKQSTKMRVAIAKSAARQALGADELLPGGDPQKKPSAAALEVIGKQADTKAIGGAINFLQKQTSSMGSFVNNIGMQVDKVAELSKDLKTLDTRLLNIPLRTLRGRIAGSPLQAKYDMYLTEIESEIGKLATGSSASIAELSATAQEKWSRIHDKNLSVKDMLELLEETKNAARMRLRSVEDELDKARSKMRTRDYAPTYFSEETRQEKAPQAAPQAAIEHLRKNPHLKGEFQTKYDYLPEGM